MCFDPISFESIQPLRSVWIQNINKNKSSQLVSDCELNHLSVSLFLQIQIQTRQHTNHYQNSKFIVPLQRNKVKDSNHKFQICLSKGRARNISKWDITSLLLRHVNPYLIYKSNYRNRLFLPIHYRFAFIFRSTFWCLDWINSKAFLVCSFQRKHRKTHSREVLEWPKPNTNGN